MILYIIFLAMTCLPFKVIYEDKDLLAVSKKEGVCVIRGRGTIADNPSLTDMLKTIYGDVFVLHRIDRETSGVVVFAKNARSHKDISILFEKRKVFKSYLAVVWGRIERGLSVDKPLKEFSSGRCGVSDDGKKSITKIKPLLFFKNFSIIKAFPYTGRRHQIRVHLYSIGHPVAGDRMYGIKEEQSFFKRMFLHSTLISFEFNGKIYRFEDRDGFIQEVYETFKSF